MQSQDVRELTDSEYQVHFTKRVDPASITALRRNSLKPEILTQFGESEKKSGQHCNMCEITPGTSLVTTVSNSDLLSSLV